MVHVKHYTLPERQIDLYTTWQEFRTKPEPATGHLRPRRMRCRKPAVIMLYCSASLFRCWNSFCFIHWRSYGRKAWRESSNLQVPEQVLARHVGWLFRLTGLIIWKYKKHVLTPVHLCPSGHRWNCTGHWYHKSSSWPSGWCSWFSFHRGHIFLPFQRTAW